MWAGQSGDSATPKLFVADNYVGPLGDYLCWPRDKCCSMKCNDSPGIDRNQRKPILLTARASVLTNDQFNGRKRCSDVLRFGPRLMSAALNRCCEHCLRLATGEQKYRQRERERETMEDKNGKRDLWSFWRTAFIHFNKFIHQVLSKSFELSRQERARG